MPFKKNSKKEKEYLKNKKIKSKIKIQKNQKKGK